MALVHGRHKGGISSFAYLTHFESAFSLCLFIFVSPPGHSYILASKNRRAQCFTCGSSEARGVWFVDLSDHRWVGYEYVLEA